MRNIIHAWRIGLVFYRKIIITSRNPYLPINDPIQTSFILVIIWINSLHVNHTHCRKLCNYFKNNNKYLF